MIVLAASAAGAAQPTTFLHVSQVVNFAALALATVVLWRRWRTDKSEATGWALAMFAVFALIAAAGSVPVKDDGSLLRHGYTVVLICVLLLIPYMLVRFAYSLGAVSTRSHRIAVWLTVAALLATLASPRFPQPGEPRTDWFTAYVVVILIGWTVQSVLTANGLRTAGNGQPSVIRHRMHTLSLGAVVMTLALVSSAASNSAGTTSQVITTLFGVLGICLLVLAFVVPRWLRAAWRAADLVDLGTAERGLMTAVTPKEVAVAIVPAVVRLFGAGGAALLDTKGRAIVSQGLSADDLTRLHDQLLSCDPNVPVAAIGDGGLACRLNEGWLVVQAGTFAPVFDATELSLLDRVGSFIDLALQRCKLLDQEIGSRRTAEAAAAELETLIYSVSHDLRAPIISVLGYLDLLAREHAGQLLGDGSHYLERISVNAMYMQSLIEDLLELSRIGRSEPPPKAVDMGALAESVAQEVRLTHPGCDISVEGSFPVLWMSEVRARQLLTNLVDNAAKHAQEAVRVDVQALSDRSGGAVLLITDNGNGIAPHYRDKAFDVFERLDAARTETPGTGMGLPICKRIAESLGATITLEGPPAGSPTGTTVRIALPDSVVQAWTTPRIPYEKENA